MFQNLQTFIFNERGPKFQTNQEEKDLIHIIHKTYSQNLDLDQ